MGGGAEAEMEELEKILESTLETDEKLLWKSGAEPFDTLDVTYKSNFVIKTVIAAIVAVGLTVLYLVMIGGFNEYFKPLIVLIFFGFAAIAPLNVIADAKRLRKAIYAATDRRLILVRDSVRSMEYYAIKEAAFRADEAGHVSLLCGKDALAAKPHKWREMAVVGQGAMDGGDLCKCFVFYAPEKAGELKAILKEKIPGLQG